MLEDHRAGPRHDSLLSTYTDDDSQSGWMVSYIDVMTLLVALFVIIIAAAGVTSPTWAPQEVEVAGVERLAAEMPTPRVIPLPAELAQLRPREESPLSPVSLSPVSTLSPAAISAALGVAGLPPPRRESHAPPLLARVVPEEAESVVSALAREADVSMIDILLPRPLLPTHEQAARPPLADASPAADYWPLADYMVLLTDRPPVNVAPVDDVQVTDALVSDETLMERMASSLYLPDLDGVEVSRVAEGISLRVQDQLLFPSATADLSAAGSSLVDSLLETIQRFEGEVWVEGHSDSQSINTPEFSSNWALSSARAIAIVEALEAAGVAPQRLRAVGLADTQPLDDNRTAEGRARNRRVEVVIHVE